MTQDHLAPYREMYEQWQTVGHLLDEGFPELAVQAARKIKAALPVVIEERTLTGTFCLRCTVVWPDEILTIMHRLLPYLQGK
jgi:hypothetical protein